MTPLSLLKGIIMSKKSFKEIVEINTQALKANTQAVATNVALLKPVVRAAVNVAFYTFAIIGIAAVMNKNK
jgi:hypothetical protein